jgi:hypothetical protein
MGGTSQFVPRIRVVLDAQEKTVNVDPDNLMSAEEIKN